MQHVQTILYYIIYTYTTLHHLQNPKMPLLQLIKSPRHRINSPHSQRRLTLNNLGQPSPSLLIIPNPIPLIALNLTKSLGQQDNSLVPRQHTSLVEIIRTQFHPLEAFAVVADEVGDEFAPAGEAGHEVFFADGEGGDDVVAVDELLDEFVPGEVVDCEAVDEEVADGALGVLCGVGIVGVGLREETADVDAGGLGKDLAPVVGDVRFLEALED